LPSIYDSEDFMQLQKSYCADYLKEEIFAEGLVRKLQPFSRFLEIAAIGDSEVTSFETIARDCGVSAPTVRSYFEILVDTLGDMACAIEAKSSEKIHQDHLKGLREIIEDYPTVGRRIVVSLEPISRRTEDGIEILSVPDFLAKLWNDEIV